MRDLRRPPARCPFTLSLVAGANVRHNAGGAMDVAVGGRQYDLGTQTPGLVDALERLAGPGATEEELRRRLVEREGADALPALYLCLLELTSRGLLCHGVVDGGTRLLTSAPASPRYRVGPARDNPMARVVLSRFAFLRRDGGHVVLESPRARARVVVHDWRGAALVAMLVTPARADDLDAGALGMSREAVGSCVDLLESLAFLGRIDAAGGCDEDADDALAAWEFHDLLFHSRSRRGRHRQPYGATYPLRDRMDPLPAVKPRPAGDVAPLFRPDLAAIRTCDRPFTTVLEARRSRRRHASLPITGRQLGEFLYRSCRIRRVIPAGARELYEATDRVYPSGGAAYPLEVYVLVDRCEGVTAGLYHYGPLDHDLTRLTAPTAATRALLESAAFAAGGFSPQVLVVLAARVQRVTWKYSSMAYAIILKDVGVMYQTMSLVATAMGLAGCPLGGGNADQFADASALGYYVEPSVGEFILGTVSGEVGE